MSIDNSELLMLLGGKKSKSTIGIAGQQGFGVGVYGGDPADLTAMGLAPMKGCKNPNSENYGNYIHTNGSVMVFIPAFCYRIGNQSSPLYPRYQENSLDIRDASEGEGDGWILHRAFIDGGKQKLGFFIDKYICSYAPNPINAAVSVKNGDNIQMNNVFVDIPDTSGDLTDAITLGRSRGEHYSCVTCFQWSAISMLSLAHGQAATDSRFCGWFDSEYLTNYPKGNNKDATLTDADDPSVKWTAHGEARYLGKTGSGSPFNKTTHNGQNCGVTDVNGSQWQVTIGFIARTTTVAWILKESVKAHNVTKNTRYDVALFNTDTRLNYVSGNKNWGGFAFFTDSPPANKALCGVFPKYLTQYKSILFGGDTVDMAYGSDSPLVVGGFCDMGYSAGIWARSSKYYWTTSTEECSFRISGYAN
jgi:hypothetical protein